MKLLFNKRFLLISFAVIIFLAFFNSLLASTHPDGLERVAEDLGFIEHAEDSFSIFGDYELPFGGSLLSSGLAGLLGVALTFFILIVIGKVLVRKKAVNQ